ncbi:MAG: PAS domain-containing sensor histidine kinase [Candidatus Cloacimonetes bacterium]|nr:PAS domain-containing sensor histidine kinase [Candidatus Cloacimonadota bacterium]
MNQQKELKKLKEKIKELQNLESSFRKRKDYYKNFIATLLDWVWEMDINGIHTYSNKAVEDILGYKPEEIVGLNVTALWEKKVTANALKILYDNLKQGIGWERVQGKFLHKNGSIVYTESTAIALYDENDKLTGYRGVDRDITNRVTARIALQESEERYKKLFLSSNDAIMTLAPPEWHFTSGNPAIHKLFHVKNEEEFIQIHPWDISPERQPDGSLSSEKALQNIEKAMREGSNFFEWIHKKINGENFTATVLLTRVDLKNVSFLQATVRDISVRKKTEERLKIVNSIIRHDITNNLAVIRSAVNLYKRNPDKTLLDEILTRVKTSLNAIDRHRNHEVFLDTHTSLQEMDINKVINEIASSHSKIEIRHNGNCYAYADEGIYSMFDNIIDNSIKHGKADKLEIKVTSDDQFCEIHCSDNGIGIPDDIKSKIFNKGFFYGESGHTGIGLYIVKQMIEDYGGTIFVKDNKPKGTAFVIRLQKGLKLC